MVSEISAKANVRGAMNDSSEIHKPDRSAEDHKNEDESMVYSPSTTPSADHHEEVVQVSDDTVWPEDVPGSWFQRWTYSYMNEILRKGAQQTLEDGTHLSQDDLFPAPNSMKAAHLAQQFRKYYDEAAKNDANPQEDVLGKDRQRRQRGHLMRALWQIASSEFLPAGVCEFVAVLCQVAMPLFVRELLRVMEDENSSHERVLALGLPYALAIFVAAVVNAFSNHRHRHLATKSGVLMRASVVTILYQHVLRLSPQGRIGVTTGEVTNLIAVDTQKLFEVAQEAHLIWALPLSILLVTICLVLTMGPVTLVGIAVLVLFVPLVERITSLMGSIRQDRVKMTDERVGVVNAMLQGMKVTKLNNYEENYKKRVSQARATEEQYLRKELAVWATTLFIMVLSPVIATASTFAVYVLVDESNILTAANSFSVLLLFSALRFPINYFGRLIGRAAQALSAINRITRFLVRETRNGDSQRSTGKAQYDCKPNDDKVCRHESCLHLSHAAFRIGGYSLSASADEWMPKAEGGLEPALSDDFCGLGSDGSFTVASFDLKVQKGQILAVCGPVGSGKSTLVQGIIDEVPAFSLSAASSAPIVTLHGRVAYVPQTPFVLNATLRDNILFGNEYDPVHYNRVVDACCLRTDIEQLGWAGDMTEIGERGVTLSGGQKQRVSLARAAYFRPDVILLDDPLSALDAGTAKLVFERLIRSSHSNSVTRALFSTAAVLLVTHASHFLHRVDQVLLVVEGKNQYLGTWSDLADFKPRDSKTRGAVDFILSSVQEQSNESHKSERHSAEDEKQSAPIKDNDNAPREEEKRSFMSVEDREHGLSSLRAWLLWFTRAGGMYFLGIQVILMTIDRFAYVGLEWWLTRWTSGAHAAVDFLGLTTIPPQTDGRHAQYQYLMVYAVILLISLVATLTRSEWSVTGGSRAASRVFDSMLKRVLGAPIGYFESTPMGRILNRFTFDMEVIDIILTQNLSMFIISCSWFVASIVVMSTILPYIILAIVPVTVLYWLLLLHYRRSGADLQRLDAVSRSPIQAKVTEGLDGAASIRVFHKGATFIARLQQMVDVNTSALLCFVSAQRWLGLRIEVMGSTIVLISTLLMVSLDRVLNLSPGLIGLQIIWSSNFTMILNFLVDTFGEAEAAITAIERVDAMARLPQEKTMITSETRKLEASWPQRGELEFENVCLRYREGLPLALDNLSFVIPPGKRCGVVGRTGAGKSSLSVALFRLVEIESGKISLDGEDLGTLGLSDVRGRANGMTIIPQDPFLVGATVRECLDPFGQKADAEMIDALEAVRLLDGSGGDGEAMLNANVEEGGSNFSVGERQLLNLARAMLFSPKVLVLDEATASIDGETDAFIQRMLRTRFADTTLVTVAHRLGTIMDYDLILVMDKGRAVEFGTPADLLNQAEEGAFSSLVEATGPESAKALRAMVDKSKAAAE